MEGGELENTGNARQKSDLGAQTLVTQDHSRLWHCRED